LTPTRPAPIREVKGASRPVTPQTPDEATLVERARDGDEDAFAELARLASPVALAAARRVTGDPALAEDAAQEAFLRAFRALSSYRHQTSFAAWMRVIALRSAIDLVRRRRPEVPLADTLRPSGSEEKRHVDADLLRETLAALTPLDRELLLARELEGEADREIANRFGMTITGVRVRIHRARKKLRARFRRRDS
jgi:RNA polymerase sigma-70 factor (ECF subfamily)